MSFLGSILAILICIAAKLTTSIDDLVWLLPFVSADNKTTLKRVIA